jgi:hypothetical protein
VRLFDFAPHLSVFDILRQPWRYGAAFEARRGNMNTTTFETVMALRDEYFAADEACDFPKRDRLGRNITKIEDAEMAAPSRSDGEAATKLQFVAFELGLSFSEDACTIAARIRVISGMTRAADSPQRRFDLHDLLAELKRHAERLPRIVDLERGMLERTLPLLEAAIAWLERPRIEHYPSAKARIYYVSRGFTMISGDGEPVSAGLSHLSVLSVA